MLTPVMHDFFQQIDSNIPQHGMQGIDFMRQETPLSLYQGLFMLEEVSILFFLSHQKCQRFVDQEKKMDIFLQLT